MDTQATRALGGCGGLGTREDAPAPRQTERVTVSVPLTASQSAAFSYIGYRMPQVIPRPGDYKNVVAATITF